MTEHTADLRREEIARIAAAIRDYKGGRWNVLALWVQGKRDDEYAAEALYEAGLRSQDTATARIAALEGASVQDAATIRSNVGLLVGWATGNVAMRADLARNAVTLIEAGLSGITARAAHRRAAPTPDDAGLRPSPDTGPWATFEDEDGVWRIVTQDGDDVTWPEMGKADVERVVAEHNRLVAGLRPSPDTDVGLDVERLARAIQWAETPVGAILPSLDSFHVRATVIAEHYERGHRGNHDEPRT